jgi:hypothetical protein
MPENSGLLCLIIDAKNNLSLQCCLHEEPEWPGTNITNLFSASEKLGHNKLDCFSLPSFFS